MYHKPFPKMSNEDFYTVLASQMKISAVKLIKYGTQVNDAYKFAEGAPKDTWDGLFLMGLALVGLELIPISSGIEKDPIWVTAPTSTEWGASWIVPRDALSSTS